MQDPVPTSSLRISASEYRERKERLAEHAKQEGAAAALVFEAPRVLYYSGFAFYPTERPVALIVTAEGESHLFVPRLELEHAQQEGFIDHVHHYDEYPRLEHPMLVLARLLEREGLIGGSIVADHDGYPWVFGYTGPSLSEASGSTVKSAYTFMDHQMSVKSAAEIGLMKESMKWANMAHTLLQRYTQPGVSEIEVSMRASLEATLAMKDALGGTYKAQAMGFFNEGALALYRGQIGKNSSLPHALTGNLEFAMGDVLVTGATAPVWGYLSEIERTMFVGEPSKEQVRLFGLMKEAQEVAFAAMRPGALCAEVDRAVNDFFAANDLGDYWRHHSGHGIGIRNHESPFLDIGTQIPLEPGMVFAVEPGLYHPEFGGYRHADTVLITETGAELLSYYPRDLGSLVIAV